MKKNKTAAPANSLAAKKIFKDPRMGYVLFGLVMCLVPLLQTMGMMRTSNVLLLGQVLIYCIAAVGMNVLLGWGGLLSIGSAGFMGLAAYLTAYVTQVMGLPFELGALVGVIVPTLIGLIIGLISLRIRGIYLAIASTIVAEILYKIFREVNAFTNTYTGRKAPYPTLFGAIKLNQNTTFIMVTVILVLTMVLVYNFSKSRTGRAMLSMRGSEVAAQAMGVNLLKYRLLAFTFATVTASVAGVLYAHFYRFIYPGSWSLTLSLYIVVSVIIGGQRSIGGSVLGAFVVFGFPEFVLKKIPVLGDMSGFPLVFTGILIIVLLLGYPQGLMYLPGDIVKAIRKKCRKGGDAA